MDPIVTYVIPATIFFGGITAILYLRHITRHERRRDHDSTTPAE